MMAVVVGVVGAVAVSGPVADAEQVTTQSFPSGYHLLRNYHTGLCMTAKVASSVIVTTCDPSGNSHSQDWLITHVGVLGGIDVFEIMTYHLGPDVCLDDEPSGVVMLTCTGNHAQLWWIRSGDVALGWQDYHTGKVINAQNGRVVADSWTGNHSQQWYQCPGNPSCSQIGL
jgi:hypothetical protein